MNKTAIALLIICFFLIFSLGAQAPSTDALGISLDSFWYGSIPSPIHEDPLPIRSHIGVGTTIYPAMVRLSQHHQLAMGVRLERTSRSLLYGFSFWRPFWGFGASVQYAYYFDAPFALFAEAMYLATIYEKTWQWAAMGRFSVKGGYRLTDAIWLIFPLSVDIRNDYLGISSAVAIQWIHTRRTQ
ncbi:MAG: hypothetical protein ACOXZ4_06815 [Sphaerochaetaceae bacterium]